MIAHRWPSVATAERALKKTRIFVEVVSATIAKLGYVSSMLTGRDVCLTFRLEVTGMFAYVYLAAVSTLCQFCSVFCWRAQAETGGNLLTILSTSAFPPHRAWLCCLSGSGAFVRRSPKITSVWTSVTRYLRSRRLWWR